MWKAGDAVKIHFDFGGIMHDCKVLSIDPEKELIHVRHLYSNTYQAVSPSQVSCNHLSLPHQGGKCFLSADHAPRCETCPSREE